MSEFASANLTIGQVNAIVKKLGGEEGALSFLRDELVVKPASLNWSAWKTIKLGTGLKSADDFRKAITASGMKIGDWANDILGKPEFTAISQETELGLVVVSVAELGFKKGATREQIYNRAKERGLELCPAEVGPQLRLQYVDQPLNDRLVIGMEPIRHSDGFLYVFNVARHDAALWLHSDYDYPDYVWDSGTRFVFVRRK